MAEHPYKDLPDSAFWRRAVANLSYDQVDPVISVPFTISKTDRIATAGSCLAQHISRHLKNNGFNFFDTEEPHPIVPPLLAAAYGYNMFSARYGNIYTARQLLQLFKRAFGKFTPVEDVWRERDENPVDPFRPQIQPGGFSSMEEFLADRKQHLGCVRRLFKGLDIFVFTLGLTECWISSRDGSAYPLCPGVAGGKFDETRHAFRNFSVHDVVADMRQFINLLKGVNSKARIILTVSPVPLIATAAGRHVLTSTVYSKSVLRVACEMIAQGRDDVAYFPSYEIIAGSYNRGMYFEADCRSVSEAGVSHVVRLFLRHFAGIEALASEDSCPACNLSIQPDKHTAEMERLLQVMCDEEALER